MTAGAANSAEDLEPAQARPPSVTHPTWAKSSAKDAPNYVGSRSGFSPDEPFFATYCQECGLVQFTGHSHTSSTGSAPEADTGFSRRPPKRLDRGQTPAAPGGFTQGSETQASPRG
jgi:hypothetical protein